MASFKGKDFKKLKAEWYQKLADSGFDDIETPSGQVKHRFRPDYPKSQMFHANSEYYLRLGQVPLDEVGVVFGPSIAVAWKMLAEGDSVLQISEKLGLSREKLAKTIARIKDRYKIPREERKDDV